MINSPVYSVDVVTGSDGKTSLHQDQWVHTAQARLGCLPGNHAGIKVLMEYRNTGGVPSGVGEVEALGSELSPDL